MRIRLIEKKIAAALVGNTPRVLSVRDRVECDERGSVYILWKTWIVRRSVSGELTWNTSQFPFSNSRTTKNRFRILPEAIKDFERLTQWELERYLQVHK